MSGLVRRVCSVAVWFRVEVVRLVIVYRIEGVERTGRWERGEDVVKL